jgi:hypothetical protein
MTDDELQGLLCEVTDASLAADATLEALQGKPAGPGADGLLIAARMAVSEARKAADQALQEMWARTAKSPASA